MEVVYHSEIGRPPGRGLAIFIFVRVELRDSVAVATRMMELPAAFRFELYFLSEFRPFDREEKIN